MKRGSMRTRALTAGRGEPGPIVMKFEACDRLDGGFAEPSSMAASLSTLKKCDGTDRTMTAAFRHKRPREGSTVSPWKPSNDRENGNLLTSWQRLWHGAIRKGVLTTERSVHRYSPRTPEAEAQNEPAAAAGNWCDYADPGARREPSEHKCLASAASGRGACESSAVAHSVGTLAISRPCRNRSVFLAGCGLQT